MTYIILVLPYLMGDLVRKEHRKINSAIDSAVPCDPLHGLPTVTVEDPCEGINDALLYFLTRVLLKRASTAEASFNLSLQAWEVLLTDRGIKLIEKLKEVSSFPKKSGEQAAWNSGSSVSSDSFRSAFLLDTTSR